MKTGIFTGGKEDGNGQIVVQVHDDGSLSATPIPQKDLPKDTTLPPSVGITAIKESGGDTLIVGAIADGEATKRVGKTLVGYTASGGINGTSIKPLTADVGTYATLTVDYAAQGTLPAFTAAGAGPGKTLTANANGALTVDGVLMTVGKRILYQFGNNAAQANRGLYTVTAAGSAGTPWILTRTTDFDENVLTEINDGNLINVTSGTDAGKTYRFTFRPGYDHTIDVAARLLFALVDATSDVKLAVSSGNIRAFKDAAGNFGNVIADAQVQSPLGAFDTLTVAVGFTNITGTSLPGAGIPDATGGSVIDAECRAQTAAIAAFLRSIGFIAP